MQDSNIEYKPVRGEPLKHATQHVANVIEGLLKGFTSVAIEHAQISALLNEIHEQLREKKIPTHEMMEQLGQWNCGCAESLVTMATSLHLVQGMLFSLLAVHGYTTENGRDTKPSVN